MARDCCTNPLGCEKCDPTYKEDMRDFSQPWEVRDVDIAFPAGALEHMPAMEDIPDKYKSKWYNEWPVKFWKDAFFYGVDNISITPKDGINSDEAFRHLRSIVGSFDPKHEHKFAALSYLTDKWFEEITWSRVVK